MGELVEQVGALFDCSAVEEFTVEAGNFKSDFKTFVTAVEKFLFNIGNRYSMVALGDRGKRSFGIFVGVKIPIYHGT